MSTVRVLHATPDTLTQLVPFETYTPKVAIVTGGAQGIGLAIVQRFADDGIDVAVNDIPANKERIDKVVAELRKKGRRAVAVPGDVSVEADVISIVEKTATELGGVDILVANAGIYPLTPFLDTNIETFDRVIAVNLRGLFLLFKYGALQMIKQGRGGRLIGAGSLAGRQGTANAVAYCSSKFGLRGIVQSTSIELRKYGITVNGFAPGPVATPELAKVAGYANEEEFLKAGSFGGMVVGKPESQASLVSYLAKPEAYFITGQTINVNGGVSFE